MFIHSHESYTDTEFEEFLLECYGMTMQDYDKGVPDDGIDYDENDQPFYALPDKDWYTDRFEAWRYWRVNKGIIAQINGGAS